ncbi:MAG: diguanylate cyclase [Cyanobacteria bacterium P01_G01_bin.19]
MKILSIESDSKDASKIVRMLEECAEQYEVIQAKNIQAAIEQLSDANIEAILLSLSAKRNKLADLNLVQEIAPQLPIIVLAKTYDAKIAVSSLRRGAQDYLVKDELEGSRLVRSIEYAIERQRIEFNERQQVFMKKMLDKIRNSIDLAKILKTTVCEIQKFLNTEEVLIYHCASNHPEEVLIVSSSEDKSAETVVTELVSHQDPKATSVFDLLPSQTVCIQAISDNQVESIPDHSTSGIRCAKSYLSLPIHVDESEDCIYKNLTHPIIQQENASEPAEELWGLLIAYNTDIPRKWRDWEIGFLQKLTTQVTICIQQSQLWSKLQTANQKLHELAILDGLTKIPNRRYFDLVLDNEWKRLTREQKPLSLVLCDIDYFKAYNDACGHQQGDLCLQQIAHILQECTGRSTDLVARYGGEEFAIILPNTDADGALFVARNINRKLALKKICHPQSSVSPYVTCSMGVSTLIPSSQKSVSTLIKNADKSLYEAKNLGRNRIAAIAQGDYQAIKIPS